MHYIFMLKQSNATRNIEQMLQATKFSHMNIWVTAAAGYVPAPGGPEKGAWAIAYFPVYKQTNPRQILRFGKFI